VSTTAAGQYAALRSALAPYQESSPSTFYALDGLSGLVYLLGGEVLGSTWTDPGSMERSAAILELACRNGDADATQPPILLLNRPLDPRSARALATCGFDYPADYVRVRITGGPPGVSVYAPR